MRPEQITDVIAFHGEGPVWHSSWGGLRMVDMLAGTILTLSGSGEVTRIATGSRIAAFVRPRERGGYVAGLERGIGLADAPFAPPTPLREMWSDPNVRMNECGLDPWGRLYAGSMPYDRTLGAGRLYRIEADGRYSTALYHVTVSNGLDFAPDGQRAYYNDTSTGCTDVFDVVGGDLVGRRPLHDGAGGLRLRRQPLYPPELTDQKIMLPISAYQLCFLNSLYLSEYRKKNGLLQALLRSFHTLL